MQTSYFKNGGYAVHKITINGFKFSAWFNATGTLTDAEKFNSVGHSIKPTAGNLKTLQAIYGNRQSFATAV